MEYKLNYNGKIEVCKIEVKDFKGVYTTLSIKFNAPLYVFVNDNTKFPDLITTDRIDVSRYCGHYGTKEEVHNLIDRLLTGSAIDDDFNKLVIYEDNENLYNYKLADIIDNNIKSDLIKMIQLALIDYLI